MTETVVKTVENVDRLFSQIVVNGEVHESENYVTPTPSQSAPQTQPAVAPEPEPSSEPASTQGEDIYGVDLNDVLHNFVDNSVPDKIQQAVESLDVPSSGGSGKYIKSISQTDGKIVATEGNITDSVASGSSDPVTSGAVADVLSALPTDAVLHYSFDEVPDYPDGTAIEKYIKDFTSVPTNWSPVSYGVLSVSGGKLINTITNGTEGRIRRYYSSSDRAIIKIKIRATINCTITISYYDNTTYAYKVITTLANAQAGQDYVLTGYIPRIDYVLIKAVTPTATDFQLILSEYYVGDGSYATPIIDNANGQNNGTNNGGIAVKGVSGKGAYFIAGKYSQCDFNLTPNFTISVWVNPSDNVSGKSRNIVHKTSQLILRNGASFGNYLQVYLYGDSSTLLNGADFGSLLPPNVWTHIVIVRNGLEFSMYKNSVKTRTINLADNTLRQNTEKFKVANEANTGNQSVDDLLIFDRALSETEVKALYLNRGNTPKLYNINNYELENAQPSFGCPRGGTYTLNRLTKQSIGKLNIYAGSVTFGADASGGNMYLNIDGLINTNADACFSQWTIRDVNSGYLDLSASTSIWVRIGITSATYLQTADCAGKTMDFVLITKTK